MRVLARLSLMAFVCAVGLLAVARPAKAGCDCQRASVAESLATQQLAFVGTLTATEPADPLVVYAFTVDHVFLGDTTVSTKVGTLGSTDDCGFGPSPETGRWLVFASRFPDASGPLLMNSCSATGPLAADAALPDGLGDGHLPTDAPIAHPPPSPPIPALQFSWSGPPDWRKPVITVAVVAAAVGVIARVLGGRRRTLQRWR